MLGNPIPAIKRWINTEIDNTLQAVDAQDDPGLALMAQGRALGLSQVIEYITGSPAVTFGECCRCQYVGLARVDATQCPGCGVEISAGRDEWYAFPEITPELMKVIAEVADAMKAEEGDDLPEITPEFLEAIAEAMKGEESDLPPNQ